MERDPSSGTEDTVAATEPVATSDTPAVFDRYRAGSVIGRGGMGEVVSARDEQIGRSVAIKRLRTRDADPEVVARFLREARIQGRLEHPAIVPVHELHDAGAEPYFVMKQLAGTTLHDVIAERPRNVLLRAFVDVCLAIEFAHTRGVIHRDLKPANIMLGDFGEVYVLDWGIARVAGEEASRKSFADIDSIESMTQAGAVLGTPGYMSPEQIRGDSDLDGRSDVYALGCILFEILAGKTLHPRGQAGLASALAGIEALPSKLADVPPELDRVCLTATATTREARFASARALADAVQRYLDGDRDLAMRRDLSRAELDRARDALARDDRVEALRAAGRAVALDPRAREPAELVARLMLEPPKEMPQEVEQELTAIDEADTQRQADRGRRAMLLTVLFLPFMYFSGLKDTWFIVALCVLVGTDMVMTRFMATSMRATWVAIAVSSGFVLLLAHAMTPLLVAPGMAAIVGGLLAAMPRLRPVWLLYAILTVPLLALWGVQWLGWLPRSIEVVGDSLVLHSAATQLDASWGLPGLALWLLAGPAIAIGLARSILRDRQRLQRALQLQSWQLRQLVPHA
jgi:serine/threonine-protein kinase